MVEITLTSLILGPIYVLPEKILVVCNLVDIFNIFTGIREQQWILDNYYLYEYVEWFS